MTLQCKFSQIYIFDNFFNAIKMSNQKQFFLKIVDLSFNIDYIFLKDDANIA